MASYTVKFRNDNPKVYAAVLKALKRAEQMIGEDPRGAAAVLLESMGGKGWTVDELAAILADPAIKYTTRPENVLAYGRFMQETGSLKMRPTSVAEVFFDSPEVAGGN